MATLIENTTVKQKIKSTVYSCALRFKKGEYEAISNIPASLADHILPRFIVPPPKERDTETGMFLKTTTEAISKTSKRLGKYWPKRPCLLEAQHLIAEYGEDNIENWLPELFRIARSGHAYPIPLLCYEGISSKRLSAYKKCVDSSKTLQIGIKINTADLSGEELKQKLDQALSAVGVQQENSVIIIDFADADLTDVDAVSEFIQIHLQTIQEAGIWAKIIYQATSFPETNTVADNSTEEFQRNGWKAWKKARAIDQNVSDNLIFGDYAADSAKINFKNGGGGRPIPHYRYCAGDKWIVIRGNRNESFSKTMRETARRLIKHTEFAGETFSEADMYISQTALNLVGIGNAAKWRELNTMHHILSVMKDLENYFTYRYNTLKFKEPVQETLL